MANSRQLVVDSRASFRRYRHCRWAGAPPGLISLASGFDSQACNSFDCGFRIGDFGLEKASPPPFLSIRNPQSPIRNSGREPDTGSPGRFAKARGREAIEGSTPSPSATAPVVKRNHAALRTRRSKFESWPGYSWFATRTDTARHEATEASIDRVFRSLRRFEGFRGGSGLPRVLPQIGVSRP